MLRIIISITKFIVATMVLLLFSSCNFGESEISGSGNVISETRSVTGQFTKVKAGNGIDVVIEQADVVSVVVEADDNLVPHIKTEVRGNTLEITCDFNNFMNVASKKVIVKLPKVESLTTDSGAALTTTGSIRSADLDLDAASGSSITGSFEVDDLSADTGSGASMKLEGKAIKFDAASASGSTLDSGELVANDVIAEASSGSSLLVHPMVELKGKASSGGSVKYNTEPQKFSKDESSGGSVSKK